MFSNKYIIIYSSLLVVIVAIALTVVAVQLKPIQEENIRIEKMRNILGAVNIETTVKDAAVLYKKYITETRVVNNKGQIVENVEAFTTNLAVELKKAAHLRNLPVYVFSSDKGEKLYIVPVRGKGLWGPVWGYISFKSDFNTIAGAIFDHKGETPGLGAEIDTKPFQKQFFGKKIIDNNSTFISVKVVKGNTDRSNEHLVDAISGGTITSDGVSKMLFDCLKEYQMYFNKIKSETLSVVTE